MQRLTSAELRKHGTAAKKARQNYWSTEELLELRRMMAVDLDAIYIHRQGWFPLRTMQAIRQKMLELRRNT